MKIYGFGELVASTNPIIILNLFGIFQTLKISMFFRIIWSDPRLKYPKDKDLAMNNEFMESIWVPDCFFERSRAITTIQMLKKINGIIVTKAKEVFTSVS